MQIYFHSHLCSYLSRVPILVEGTVDMCIFFGFYIFMHLADTFIQSDLLCLMTLYNIIQVILFFCQHVRSLGIELTTFCAANAILYH